MLVEGAIDIGLVDDLADKTREELIEIIERLRWGA